MRASNQLIKVIIRIWIALTALLGFFGGWGLLAHGGKPASAQSAQEPAQLPTPLPTLPPLNFDNSSSQSLQPLPALPSLPQISAMPRLRTGGS